MSCDDDEVIIDDDGDIGNDDDEDYVKNLDLIYDQIQSTINFCEAFLANCAPSSSKSSVFFSIPKDVLPLSLQMVCGFYISPIVLKCKFDLNTMSSDPWKATPNGKDVKHPTYGQNYIGKPLVEAAIINFFSSKYHPKQTYKAAIYLFKKSGIANKQLKEKLIKESFNPDAAENALVLCDNNYEEARDYLLTGKLKRTAYFDLPTFNECPLIYLIMEIVECFLDLNDHCCICRKQLEFPGIRPQICDNQLCEFGFQEIGVGTSVAQEIKRDPLAADLIVSIFSASFSNTKYMNPKPPNDILKNAKQLFQSLPSMSNIAHTCNHDSEISQKYGIHVLEFLRWVLLTNRSQILSLPDELKIKQIPANFQFMTLISTPEAEHTFQQYKASKGSMFMWHGSGGDRWYSIIHNGLYNMSAKHDVAHGTAYGPGIYLANSSSMSFNYSTPIPNLYLNSCIKNNMKLIALCEIAKVDSLKNHGYLRTLLDEKACIVRFIFASSDFAFDAVSTPLNNIPSLDHFLQYQANKVKKY